MSGIRGNNGWLEAAIAWEVCASLHRQYCKGKDALFTTRQSDFVKHAEDAREYASRGQASAQQGVQWQCGPQASGFTAPQADSVPAPAATCPTCKAPCTTTVNMRGGEYGWGTTDLERTVYHYAPAQAADSVLKDHQIAALVNELRDIAVQYHGAQQLRERIAHVVVPAVRAAQAADSVLEDTARLDWLERAGPTSICVVMDRDHDGEVEVSTDDVDGYGNTLREAIDAAMKKGGPP